MLKHRFKNFTPVALKNTNLFKPIKIGSNELQHRVVLAPLTRLRNIDAHPSELSIKYYDQRSKIPGTLIITEATATSFEYGGTSAFVPTISTDEQVTEWKKVHKAIHDNGSFSFQQIWSLGRQSDAAAMAQSGRKFFSASDDQYASEHSEKLAKKNNIQLKALTQEEIKELIADFVHAGQRALEAGADGVEIHSANGYIPLQFLDPISNKRTDEYGGSIENRARFVLEIVDALVAAIGPDRVAIRLSPFATFGGHTGYTDPTSFVHHAYVISELERRARAGKRLAYIHMTEPLRNEDPIYDSQGNELDQTLHSNDFIHTIWNGVVIRSGDYALHPELAEQHTAQGQTLISYGRTFISNPDLPFKLKEGIQFNDYNRDLFYTHTAEGYTDYPTYEEEQAAKLEK